MYNNVKKKLTSILLFTLKKPSLPATGVGFDAPTAIIAPFKIVNQVIKMSSSKHLKSSLKLTCPGGSIASNLSTPNMPKFDRVKVPIKQVTTQQLVDLLSKN